MYKIFPRQRKNGVEPPPSIGSARYTPVDVLVTHRQEWDGALRAAEDFLKTHEIVQIVLRARSVGLSSDQILLTLTTDNAVIVLKAAR